MRTVPAYRRPIILFFSFAPLCIDHICHGQLRAGMERKDKKNLRRTRYMTRVVGCRSQTLGNKTVINCALCLPERSEVTRKDRAWFFTPVTCVRHVARTWSLGALHRFALESGFAYTDVSCCVRMCVCVCVCVWLNSLAHQGVCRRKPSEVIRQEDRCDL